MINKAKQNKAKQNKKKPTMILFNYNALNRLELILEL